MVHIRREWLQAAGCGSVIRGSDSEWLSGFAKFVGLLCKIHVAVVDV
jgi:hypothetical protein